MEVSQLERSFLFRCNALLIISPKEGESYPLAIERPIIMYLFLWQIEFLLRIEMFLYQLRPNIRLL